MASSLYVAIRGDYSKFQEDLARARGIARQNGTQISNALNNAISPQQAIQGITRLTTAIRQAQNQIGNRSAMRPGIDGLDELARVANLSSTELERLYARMQNTAAANNMRRAFAEIQHQTGMTNTQMARLRASMGDFSGAVSQLGISAKGVGVTFAAIAASGVALGKVLVDNAIQMDQIDKAFTTIMGSSEGAAGQIQFIKETSKQLGLELVSTAKSAKTFFAAAKGTNLESDMNRIFLSVSKAGAAMALSADQMEGIFLALGQMVSKGKVQAEELRGQLGERLPGAFQIAADAMGMTTAELDKFMADGKLTAQDLLPKLADALENKFASAAENAANSVQGAVNNMSNAWTEFKANITDNKLIIASINAITSAMNSVNNLFREMTEQEKAFAKVVELRKEVESLEKQRSSFGGALFADSRLPSARENLAKAEANLAEINKKTWSKTARDRQAEEARIASQRIKNETETAAKAAESATTEYLKHSQASQAQKLAVEYETAKKAVTVRMEQLEKAGQKETAEYKKLAQDKIAIDAEYKRQKEALDKKFTPKTSGSKTKKSKGQSAEEVIAELERKADLNSLKNEEKAQKEKIQQMQNEANLLKMLAEVSGNYSMSQEAQRMLIDAQTASLKQQNAALIESKPEIEAYIDEWARLAQMENGDVFDKMTVSWIQFANDAENVGKHLGDTLKSATDSFADAFVEFCTTGKFDFKSFANSIISDLARIAARASIAKIGTGLMGMFGGGQNPMVDFHSGMSAHGNVFSGGNISAYSNSIVTRPTLFGYGTHVTAYANGAGLMGEAGPEAILPLTRTSSGNLGVEATGGGAMALSLTIVDKTSGGIGVDNAQAISGGLDLNVIVQQVENAMVKRAANGKSAFASYLDQTRSLSSARSMY